MLSDAKFSDSPEVRYAEAMGVAGPPWVRWTAAVLMTVAGLAGLALSFFR